MRLFLGIPVPAEATLTLTELATKLPGQPIKPENLHITLVFLGEVKEIQLPNIITELEQIKHAPFTLTTSRINSFAGVIVLDVNLTPQLAALQSDIATRMARCGFPPEQRSYHPHITLTRSKGGGHFLSSRPPMLQIPVDHFILYRSQLLFNGSRYECLKQFRLV